MLFSVVAVADGVLAAISFLFKKEAAAGVGAGVDGFGTLAMAGPE